MSENTDITQKYIENRIFIYRGMQVMIDRDLAEMYQVEVKRLNEQVKRNLDRFPATFHFQMSNEEKNELVATCDRFKTLKHSSNNPYLFTEQGVAMLSAVLRSNIAVSVSIQIINAFIEMRKLIANQSGLLQRMESFERKQLETEEKFEKIFKALEGNNIPQQGVFFDGQVFDAYALTSKIIRTAKKNIILIDNFIDENTLSLIAKKNRNVSVLLLSKTVNTQLVLDVKKANEQYGNFEIREFINSHDRFLIIDKSEIYHIGASLKDLGKKWFAFSKLDKSTFSNIMSEIKKIEETLM